MATFSVSLKRIFAFSSLITICFLIVGTLALECYVCQNQDNNQNKCAETVKICELEQEQCLTEVRWGSIPFWALSGQRQHFISKRCATKSECQESVADKIQKCERYWYNDWNCTTCCSGDKCNYYVTLGGHTLAPFNPYLLTISTVITSLFYYLHSIEQQLAL